MAARTGAGTGVIVSLVVFVITTLAFLILTIVFYTGQNKALAKEQDAIKKLNQFVRSSELQSDWVKADEDQAGSMNMSVLGFKQSQYEKGVGMLVGNPNQPFTAAEGDLGKVGVGAEKSALAVIREQRKALDDLTAENDRKKAQLAASETEKMEFFQQLGQARESHQQELAAATAKIEEYRQEAERYRQDVQTTLDQLAKDKEGIQDRYEGQINDLNSEIDSHMQQLAVLSSRIKEFEKRLDEIRVKGTDPAMMVDGQVIDATGTADQVFIDRGRQHRVVLGMTFEVYDSPTSIAINKQTGELPRGKASLQVTKVGDSTSTCKIVRSVPGRPVVRGDVIANAIYDMKYKFKFLVHGKFDMDDDTRATDAEADYLRSQIVEWGGTVVDGESLPGDLDFLVLGEEPPLPSPPRAAASDQEISAYIQRRAARDVYFRLKEQAMQAQIPVLSANRLFILIGHTP